jgi:predicted RNase H-like HicB family nuclease
MSKTKQITRKNKSLEYYLSLNYQPVLYPDDDGGYTAEIRELPGCLTQGETDEEVKDNLQEARKLWIEVAYENGDNIPVPENSYSGKTLLRMPTSLHQKLSENADLEGISLNQYILFLLTEQNISHQLSRLIINKMKNKKFQGTKKGNTIVFDEQLDEISEGAKITVEIPENQLMNIEKRRENFKDLVSAWKDDPESEEEIIAKADKMRDSHSERSSNKNS